MNKLPFIPLYVNDWSRDLEEHPLEIEGAWFRIVCKLWWEGGTGEALKPIEAWAKILRVDNDTAKRILDYIGAVKIGDISYCGDANGMAKVSCRRMKRDWDIRQERSVAGAMGAKARWQNDGKGHGKPHGKRMKYDNDNDIDIKIRKNLRIEFNKTLKIWEGITQEDKDGWKEAYPACEIDIELAKMREWILANPAKGKKSNYRRFISGWLSREQDRGGTKRAEAPRDRKGIPLGDNVPPNDVFRAEYERHKQERIAKGIDVKIDEE